MRLTIHRCQQNAQHPSHAYPPGLDRIADENAKVNDTDSEGNDEYNPWIDIGLEPQESRYLITNPTRRCGTTYAIRPILNMAHKRLGLFDPSQA